MPGYQFIIITLSGIVATQTRFSPRLAARAKMSLSRAQNIFMPANINSIVILLRRPRSLNFDYFFLSGENWPFYWATRFKIYQQYTVTLETHDNVKSRDNMKSHDDMKSYDNNKLDRLRDACFTNTSLFNFFLRNLTWWSDKYANMINGTGSCLYEFRTRSKRF